MKLVNVCFGSVVNESAKTVDASHDLGEHVGGSPLTHLDALELLRDAWTELDILDEGIADECQVKDKTDHVTLLAVVVFVVIIVDDQVVARWGVDVDVPEVLAVGGVRKNSVPVDTLDGRLGRLGVIELGGQFVVVQVHVVGVLVVLILLDEPVSLAQLDSLEEVWQILINFDFDIRETEAPLGEGLSEVGLQDEDGEDSNTDQE